MLKSHLENWCFTKKHMSRGIRAPIEPELSRPFPGILVAYREENSGPLPSRLKRGRQVVAHSLSREELNGIVGKIVEFDRSSGRYAVDFPGRGKTLIHESNLNSFFPEREIKEEPLKKVLSDCYPELNTEEWKEAKRKFDEGDVSVRNLLTLSGMAGNIPEQEVKAYMKRQELEEKIPEAEVSPRKPEELDSLAQESKENSSDVLPKRSFDELTKTQESFNTLCSAIVGMSGSDGIVRSVENLLIQQDRSSPDMTRLESCFQGRLISLNGGASLTEIRKIGSRWQRDSFRSPFREKLLQFIDLWEEIMIEGSPLAKEEWEVEMEAYSGTEYESSTTESDYG